VFRIITGRLKDPNYRGMNYWHDMLDWLGGYPFEVAKPEMVVTFFTKDNFELLRLNTCGRKSGCNEYVFKLNQSA